MLRDIDHLPITIHDRTAIQTVQLRELDPCARNQVVSTFRYTCMHAYVYSQILGLAITCVHSWVSKIRVNIIYRRRLCLHWVMELSASVLMWEISPLYNIFVHNEVLYINLLSGIILGPSASFPYSLITTRKWSQVPRKFLYTPTELDWKGRTMLEESNWRNIIIEHTYMPLYWGWNRWMAHQWVMSVANDGRYEGFLWSIPICGSTFGISRTRMEEMSSSEIKILP